MLPAAERAHIDPAKVRDYLLSEVHPVGRFKAVVFQALGYTAEAWEELRDASLRLHECRTRSQDRQAASDKSTR